MKTTNTNCLYFIDCLGDQCCPEQQQQQKSKDKGLVPNLPQSVQTNQSPSIKLIVTSHNWMNQKRDIIGIKSDFANIYSLSVSKILWKTTSIFVIGVI